MIKLTISWKPLSVNMTYRKTNYSYYMTKVGKEYKEECKRQASMQYKKLPLSGSLEVCYRYYFWDNRVHDHLNYNKCLNDALTGIIWIDDKQIKTSHHYTLLDKDNPRVEMDIKKINA